MSKIRKLFKFLLFSLTLTLTSIIVVTASIYFYLRPELPSLESLKDVRFQIPLRVYSQDEKLIAEFGEKRRTPIKYEDVPDTFIKAVLAAEDADFFNHAGVDIKGLARAVKLLLRNRGEIQGGGSTITMQLARALFLEREQKFKRKFKEIIVAIKMERELSKEEILELYFNEIFLGRRAYGIQAAANVYYDKNIDQLTLAQYAMLAGLPKAPSAFNPVSNPERALVRRNWILGRMLRLGFIDQLQYENAYAEPVTASDYGFSVEINAPYVAEMIRQDLFSQYGESIYTDGYKAIATIDSKLQTYANDAVYEGIHQYDERHGYKGVLANAKIPDLDSYIKSILSNYQQEEPDILSRLRIKNPASSSQHADNEILAFEKSALLTEFDFLKILNEYRNTSILKVAITLYLDDVEQKAIFLLKDNAFVAAAGENILWAAPFVNINTVGAKPTEIHQVLKQGDIVYLRLHDKQWRLAQMPTVQSAFVAMNPDNGSVLALVGGYDFQLSKFNRATQGGRQAGSSIKPFIYAKALEEGYTAASIINDAPVVFEDSALEEAWRPENSGGRFYGPTRFREALYRSRNLVSIRILRTLNIRDTIASMERFGFDKTQLPDNLSLVLGSSSLTPMQMTSAFSVFANGGYQIFPNYLYELRDVDDNVVFRASPVTVCRECAPEDNNDEPPEAHFNETKIDSSIATSAIIESPEEDFDPDTPVNAKSVIDPRVNYIIDNILGDVIKRGTGYRAMSLKRNDLRGKTGTTNDQIDAWFTGYNNDIVASAWVGFDAPTTLGAGEFGATAALPIWASFMEKALTGTEEKPLLQPSGIVTLKINAATGEAATPADTNTIFEIFLEETAPQLTAAPARQVKQTETEQLVPEQLF